MITLLYWIIDTSRIQCGIYKATKSNGQQEAFLCASAIVFKNQ
jgi:hypothetical protein